LRTPSLHADIALVLSEGICGDYWAASRFFDEPGISIQTVVPIPGDDVSRMVPPLISANRLARASPMPLPLPACLYE
jgi:hypothetical protein